MQNYVLITGASGGIGRKLSLELSINSNLILSGLPLEKEDLNILRSKCQNPDNHLIWLSDLASERCTLFSSLTEFLRVNQACIEKFIHCAGITRILPFRNFTPDYVDHIFNVNLFSAIEILRVLLKKDNHGHLNNVLFISALWSVRGNAGNSIYSASKGALNSLVFSLTQELSPKIRVNALLPGAIITPMSANLNKDFVDQMEQETPLGMGSIDDVVNYACFLLSDKAKWVTGQNILVDGGRSTK